MEKQRIAIFLSMKYQFSARFCQNSFKNSFWFFTFVKQLAKQFIRRKEKNRLKIGFTFGVV